MKASLLCKSVAIGAAYFIGFMIATLVVSALLQAVGHIRLFSAMAAIAASGTLMLILWTDPLAWFALRVLMGFCFACLFATVDSWINASVSNEIRAKVLSIYRLVDIACVNRFAVSYSVLRRAGVYHLRGDDHYDNAFHGANFTG